MNITMWRTTAWIGLLCLAACASSSQKDAGSPAAAGKPAETTPALTKAELGKPAPNFTLTDLDGKQHKLSDYRGKIVVLEWFSPSCPYCVYAYSEGPLKEQPERLAKEGVVWLSVNSQNPKHPGANVDKNKAFVKAHEMEAPLLMDADGTVGRAYGAKTTPHCFVIDVKGVLVYAGGLDNVPNGKVDGDAKPINYVDAAVEDLRAGRPVTTDSARAYG